MHPIIVQWHVPTFKFFAIYLSRHFFYHALKRDLRNEKFILSQSQMTKLYALMRQTEFGDFTAKKSALEQISSATSSQVNAFEKDVEMEHEQLMGMSASVAKLKFISTLAKTEFYFCDLFKVKLGGEKLLVAVGTMGLRLINRRSPQHTREL